MQARTLRFRIGGAVGCLVLAVASCQDAPGPDAKRTTLTAASPTQLTGTVGSAVDPAPAVVVRDASGSTVAGVTVTFSVRSGGGSIQTPRAVSNANGIASAGAWTLGTSPGPNSIAATNTSGDAIVFTADGAVGPAFLLEKVEGDGQIALPGAALGVRPRVRVIDIFANPVPGIAVTFVVDGGGGSVSETPVVSDSTGIAESGEWVLGPPGLQRLVARAGQLVSPPFTARAVAPPFDCATNDTLPAKTSFRSELTALSCRDVAGRAVETYTIVVTVPGAYVFTVVSADFDTRLELRGAGLVEVAANDDVRDWETNSQIKALLVQGTYTLAVLSSKLGAVGQYDLSYRPTDTDSQQCEDVFLVRGITALGSVQSWDCTPSPNEFADRFRIYLEAGRTVEIRVIDYSYSGPNLAVISPDGSTTTVGTTSLTPLTYTPPVDGYYTVLVGLLNEYGIDYEITVR